MAELEGQLDGLEGLGLLLASNCVAEDKEVCQICIHCLVIMYCDVTFTSFPFPDF